MTHTNSTIADYMFYLDLSKRLNEGYASTKKDYSRLYRMRKNWYFESMSNSVIPDDAPKGKLITGFIDNGYYRNHSELISFMETKKAYKYAKNNIPEGKEGHLDIYVRSTDSGFEIYGKIFYPCRIIPKHWGLPHKNAKGKKIIPIRCMFEDNYTYFRASYLD